MSETSWGRRKYRTTNWKAYNAALKARGDLTIWLDSGLQWLAPPTGKRGRSQTFSDAAIQFCLTIKCLFGLPLRQTLGLVQSSLKMAGLPWAAPDYSTVCRRQKGMDVRVHYRPSRNGLHMLADSTGSSSWAKASGKPRSMELSGVASGARCIWALMQRLCRYEPLW